jgi:orotate phosphoribosyltransferase
MTQDEVLAEFRDAGALLEGHFILSSGLHSPVFLQKMYIFMDPVRTARLCGALAQKIRERFGHIDMVVSPAVGGIVPGYETARALGAKAIFVERENGRFQLRRGFAIPQGALINRSGGKADLGKPLVSLATLDIPAYPADQLPPELASLPVVKPGSRALSS